MTNYAQLLKTRPKVGNYYEILSLHELRAAFIILIIGLIMATLIIMYELSTVYCRGIQQIIINDYNNLINHKFFI